MFRLSDYQFHLPKEQIAEHACHPAHNARLMIIAKSGDIPAGHTTFWNLDTHIPRDRVLFFNNSRVLRARIPLVNTAIHEKNGTTRIISEGEIFFLRPKSADTFEALVRPGKKFRPGSIIIFPDAQITIESMADHGRLCSIQGMDMYAFLEQYGQLPLPPYIEYAQEKEADYQTVFAEKQGSVAAPTAALHFTQELLDKLPHERHMITLHVWLGTFQTIDTHDIRQYHIHEESAEIDLSVFATIARLKQSGKSLVAVGTTTCRTLESLPALWRHLSPNTRKTLEASVQEFWDTLTPSNTDIIHGVSETPETIRFTTSIYIIPGYTFLLIDELITNFHLPESSLLVLVAALIGHNALLRYYTEAIQQ